MNASLSPFISVFLLCSPLPPPGAPFSVPLPPIHSHDLFFSFFFPFFYFRLLPTRYETPLSPKQVPIQVGFSYQDELILSLCPKSLSVYYVRSRLVLMIAIFFFLNPREHVCFHTCLSREEQATVTKYKNKNLHAPLQTLTLSSDLRLHILYYFIHSAGKRERGRGRGREKKKRYWKRQTHGGVAKTNREEKKKYIQAGAIMRLMEIK